MTKGKFRSLFDADEIRELGIDAGLVSGDAPEPFMNSAAAGMDFVQQDDDDAAEVPLRGDLVNEAPAAGRSVEPNLHSPARPLPFAPRWSQDQQADVGTTSRDSMDYGTPLDSEAVAFEPQSSPDAPNEPMAEPASAMPVPQPTSPATELARRLASRKTIAPWRTMLRASLMSRCGSEAYFTTTEGSASLLVILNQLTESTSGA